MTDEQLTEQLDVAAKPLREAIAEARDAGLRITLCVPRSCFPDITTVLRPDFHFNTWRRTVIE